jgi:hypothetical protein
MKRTKWKTKKTLKAVVPKQHPRGKYQMLLPVNLREWMQDVEQNPPNIPGFKISRLQYLISLIITNKRKWQQNYWTTLNMQYMNNIVPQASQYLHFLRDEGIIEWIEYSAGRNSRLYRLVNEGWTEQLPITDMQIIRRLEKNKASLSKRNSKKYPYLNKSIRKVDMDFEAARQEIDQRYDMDIKSGMEPTEAAEKRTYALGAITRIQSGEIYYKVNDTNGRLDSNFTNLPGYLMKYLSIDGRPFIEMDITNSQPYFAGALFNPSPEILAIIEDYLPSSAFMFVKPLLTIDRQDVKLYRSLVSTGKFYEYMAEQFREHGLENHTDRKALKAQIFEVFFGKVYAEKWNDAVRLFKQLFPTVYKVFTRIKKKKHNRLAILLQRIESYTMLERVVKGIEKKHPDLNILTKHDSILPVWLLVPEKSEVLESVRNIMVDTITEVTGLKPQGRMRKLKTEKTR